MAFFLDWTGLLWHEWLGVAVGLIAFYHLLIHWKWVNTITKRFFSRTSKQSRLCYLLDWSLLLSFLVIGITGLMISTWFNLELAEYIFWKDIHVYSSIASLVIILLKIAAHWRWIVNTAAKYIGLWRKPALSPRAVPVQSGSNPGSLNRREFLQLMGVASLASLISASNLIEFGEETSREIIYAQTSISEVPASGLISPNTQSCTVICDRGCVYPGQCRRYVDLNRNGICDLTECPGAETDSQPATQSQTSPGNEVDKSADITSEITESSQEECLVLCPQTCSYPGQCPDYVDENSNNLCDLGECLASNTTLSYTPAHGGGGRRRRGENK
ncbi:MAG: DUF4405 domain-containing protein [Anaerolineales bacterium]|nr:DUF4405 domain-containing protein [Anaerolineales bacterium]